MKFHWLSVIGLLWWGQVALVPTGARASSVADAGKGSVEIARDGKSTAVVVVAHNPTRPAQWAAKEFAYHVRKITGAELPMLTDDDPAVQNAPFRVLIGESAETKKLGLSNADFKVQEYLIQTRDKTLILMGRDAEEHGPITYEQSGYWPTKGDWRTVFFLPVGTAYAVDTFLEKFCGVRWYMPGDIGEVCPKQSTLTATDLNFRTLPWSRYRWSSRQTYRDPFKFYGWKQPDERVCMPVRDLALWMFRMKIGGSPYACNHAFTQYYERFGKEHPGWWKDGKPSDHYPHPDYANPELVRQAAQDAIAFFSTGKKPPGATAEGDYFAIMPNDGKDGLIWSAAGERLRNNDPERQAGYSCGWASDFVFQMVNTAAHVVREKYPDKWITCAAYAGYSMPPKILTVLEPNVSVQRCSFLDSAFAPAQWKWETENLTDWSKHTKELYVWEYYLTQWFHQFQAFPVVYPRHVARSIQFLRETGVRGMFFEASAAKLPTASISDGALANPAEDLLNHYVTWKLLSDGSEDVEKLLDEFYPLFFGPAAAPMKEFFTLLESRWLAAEVVASKLADDRKYWEVMCTTEVLDKLQQCIERAQQATPEEPYRTRVAMMDRAIFRFMRRHFAEHRQLYTARRRISCPVASKPPLIDGILQDLCWKNATASGPLNSATDSPLLVTSSFRIAHDAKNLYLAIACGEPKMDQVGASAGSGTARPNFDEHVVLILDPGRTRERGFRIAVNRQGSLTEQVVTLGKSDSPWQSGAEVRTNESSTWWTVEIRLPLKSLTEKEISSGEVWGLNLLRYRAAAGKDGEPEVAAWSAIMESPESLDATGVMGFSSGASASELPQPVIRYDFDEEFVQNGRVANKAGQPSTRQIKGARRPTSRSAAARSREQATGTESERSQASLKMAAGGRPWDRSNIAKGLRGGGVAFHGETYKQYLEVDPSPEVNLATDDFTVGFWYKAATSQGNLLASTSTAPYWVFSFSEPGWRPPPPMSPSDGAMGVVDGEAYLRMAINSGGERTTSVTSFKDIAVANDHAWHHYLLMIDRGRMARLYLDGKPAGVMPIAEQRGALKPVLTIGGPYHFVDGALDEFVLYQGCFDDTFAERLFGQKQ